MYIDSHDTVVAEHVMSFLLFLKEVLIYMYIFVLVVLLGTVIHCTTYFGWGIFSIIFQNHIMLCKTIM